MKIKGKPHTAKTISKSRKRLGDLLLRRGKLTLRIYFLIFSTIYIIFFINNGIFFKASINACVNCFYVNVFICFSLIWTERGVLLLSILKASDLVAMDKNGKTPKSNRILYWSNSSLTLWCIL